MLNHLDLCSGIGGFALGFKWANLSKPIAFCDFDIPCQKVLAKNFPNIPIYNDVKEIANDPGKFIRQPIGVLSGGYPCQPFSTSGKRLGSEDPRHIFPYIHEIVKQVRPSYCVFENVYGHVSMGLDEVLFAMENLNYQTRTFVVSASSIGARHKRDRVWVICKNLGDSYYYGLSSSEVSRSNEENARGSEERSEETKQSEGASRSKDNGDVSNSNDKGVRSCLGGSDNDIQKESGEGRTDRERGTIYDEWGNFKTTEDGGVEVPNSKFRSKETLLQWKQRVLRETIERWETSGSHNEDVSDRERRKTQLRLGGVANGVSYWMDEPRGIPRITTEQQNRANRLKMLGNAIVPQHAYHIGLAIKEDIKCQNHTV
jgi:DNA (cytosine-5)-methyltransferase 1